MYTQSLLVLKINYSCNWPYHKKQLYWSTFNVKYSKHLCFDAPGSKMLYTAVIQSSIICFEMTLAPPIEISTCMFKTFYQTNQLSVKNISVNIYDFMEILSKKSNKLHEIGKMFEVCRCYTVEYKSVQYLFCS